MAIQEIVNSIVGTTAEKCVDPICHQFKYLIFYKSNAQTLSDDIKKLELKETEVQQKVRQAKDNDEEIYLTVVDWLKQVEDVKKDAQTISEGIESVKAKCFKVNLKSCYLLGRRAAEGKSVVEKLLEKGNFDKVGRTSSLGKMPHSESTPSIDEGLVSRLSTKKEVTEALKQEKTSLVAICGMAGVGKTTLVKQIIDQVKPEKLFDDVAMAKVSHTPDMRNVQAEIAEQLGLKITEQTDRPRAERIFSRLTNSDKSTLVILDDIWEKVDFKNLGIPVKGHCKNLKVILTSRLSDVCRDMGAEIFEVNVLPQEEAGHLFKEVAHISDDSALSDVANQVAEECKGLPLAIVVVASALRSKRTPESWKQALEQIKEYTIRDVKGVEESVFPKIEFSYDYLRSYQAKELLLLCSLFPEGYSIPIECLVRYGNGLELFEDRRRLVDVRYKVDDLISDLKSSYLLLNDGEKEDCVKLHDVVRDVCLKIASKDKHEFLVRNAGVRKKYSYTEISLILKDSIHDLLPFCKECQRLRLLRLVLQSEKFNLSKDSFIGMEDLKVMELNNSHIEFAPSSPGQMLRSLRTLCLNYCILGTGMSSMLGHMMQLETLSLFKSEIQDQFPTKIAWPSNLKLLDLRVESSFHPLPGGILSSMKKLEELYLGSPRHLQLGRDEEEERGCLKEISSISNLACLQIAIYDLNLLLPFLQEFDTQRLLRFHILVANHEMEKRDLSRNYQFRKSFQLSLSIKEALDDLSSEEELKRVFDPNVTSIIKRTENLTLNLSESSYLRNLSPDFDQDGFINLKKLDLYGGQYECLIDPTSNLVNGHFFENLVSMKLKNLKLKEICNRFLPSRWFSELQEMKFDCISTLEYLWKGQVEPPSFCNLKSIKVMNCAQITTLFSQSAPKCLGKLQELAVYNCKKLETIVLTEKSLKEDVLELPQLRVFTVEWTNLMGFWSKDDKAAAFFNQVSLPRLELLRIRSPGEGSEQLMGRKMPSGSLKNLESLVLDGCGSMRCIAKADTVILLQNLQTLQASSCSEMEFLIDFRGLKDPNTLSTTGLEVLPKLESLELEDFPRLTHIWRNFSEGVRVFQNLRSLHVVACPLNYLFYPPCVTNMLVSLEKLVVHYCSKMRGVIGEEASQENNAQQYDVEKHREIALETTSKEFEFPKLSCLRLQHLENFQSIGGSHWEDCEFKFPLLTELIIVGCPKLKKFCSGSLDAPLLKKVKTTGRVDKFEAPEDLKDKEICSLTYTEWLQRR